MPTPTEPILFDEVPEHYNRETVQRVIESTARRVLDAKTTTPTATSASKSDEQDDILEWVM
jgi:hypothetical protein